MGAIYLSLQRCDDLLSKYRVRSKRKDFLTLSRNKRGRKTIIIRNRIRKAKQLFYSDEPIFSDDYDMCFLSKKDKSIFYNTYVTTFKSHLHDATQRQASRIARPMMSIEEYRDQHRSVEFNGGRLYRADRPKLPQFDDMSFGSFKRELVPLIKDFVKVHYGYKILRGYSYGVGLAMVLPVPHLTVENISAAIEDFWSKGEVNWQNEKAMSRREINMAFSTAEADT